MYVGQRAEAEQSYSPCRLITAIVHLPSFISPCRQITQISIFQLGYVSSNQDILNVDVSVFYSKLNTHKQVGYIRLVPECSALASVCCICLFCHAETEWSTLIVEANDKSTDVGSITQIVFSRQMKVRQVSLRTLRAIPWKTWRAVCVILEHMVQCACQTSKSLPGNSWFHLDVLSSDSVSANIICHNKAIFK